ncbi:hypothetical protein [Parerythrobacter aestuarii]|uniref:hypothetical protein n=1 Tax=Parerythrobacter aestuarii TaxID=3020909 RepID=UPI0024DE7EF1|nr:hypothetical protein [Parerythrobacter aestuarii]
MIEYGLRVGFPDPTDWGSGVSLLWEALTCCSTETGFTFALSLCPERKNSVLVGVRGAFEWLELEERIEKAAQSSGLAVQLERGTFHSQIPLGLPKLASVRDDFREAMFGNLSCLMKGHPQDAPSRLIAVGETFLLLDRIDWADGLRLWPLSLIGQVWAFERTGGSAVQPAFQAAERLIPVLAASEKTHGLFQHDTTLPEHLAARLSCLQTAYKGVCTLVAEIAPAERDRLSESAGTLLADILSATHTADEARRTAAHPNHMAYRIFMSLIYDLAPLIALPTTRRIMIFRATIELLRRHYPSVMTNVFESGNQLRQPSL